MKLKAFSQATVGQYLGREKELTADAMHVRGMGTAAEGLTVDISERPLRFAEPAMGTVFSFDIRDRITPGIRAGLKAAVQWLHQVDAVYSTYRKDSDICRLARGEITLADCHPTVPEVLAIGDFAYRDSDGAFTLRPGGSFDPSGVVKGWAIERASMILREAGSRNHLINGGGDIQTFGTNGEGGWRVAVADPKDKLKPLAVLEAISTEGFSVATSGTSQRGAHIVDGRSSNGSLASSPWASITVVGSHLTEVDIAATTAFALGVDGLQWIEDRPHFAALGVTHTSDIVATSRLGEYLVTAASQA